MGTEHIAEYYIVRVLILNLPLLLKIVVRTSTVYPFRGYTAPVSNIEMIERCRSKIFRILTNAPWVRNDKLYRDPLNVPDAREVMRDQIANVTLTS